MKTETLIFALSLIGVAAAAYFIAKSLKEKAALQAAAKARYGSDWSAYNDAAY